MSAKLHPIITAEELKSLQAEKDFVLLDASYPNGFATYTDNHISGALYVDLDKDLADIQFDFAVGGRHPLPQVVDFVKVLNSLGIENDTHVVIYDRNSGAFASRMWWMMRALGHVKVQVLDGGFAQAKAAELVMSSGKEKAASTGNYSATNWIWGISDMTDVEQALSSTNQKVYDVRGEARYKGEVEPIDVVAGHIPGAINAPFANNLTEDGVFKSPETLKTQFEQVLKGTLSSNTIFHCGSGVTACHSILAMDIAGMETPSLYVGSWSEWSRNNKPMATHE